ncbi:MAG: GIY-YIG nuclease family protein [Bacteroidota bacterium]
MNSGCYHLLIYIKRKISFKAGSLGEVNLKKGYYVYTGSAMKNLNQRVERHLRKSDKKNKWHIDFLLSNEEAKIIAVKLFLSDEKEECKRNQLMLKIKNVYVPVEGFGSSDCNICPAHLLGFDKIKKADFLKLFL